MLLILKRNFCFDVNRTKGTTWCVTLYRHVNKGLRIGCMISCPGCLWSRAWASSHNLPVSFFDMSASGANLNFHVIWSMIIASLTVTRAARGQSIREPRFRNLSWNLNLVSALQANNFWQFGMYANWAVPLSNIRSTWSGWRRCSSSTRRSRRPFPRTWPWRTIWRGAPSSRASRTVRWRGSSTRSTSPSRRPRYGYWLIHTPPSTIDYRDFVSFSSVSRDLDAVKCGHWSFPGFKHCVVQICHSPICITSPIIYQSSEVGSSRVLF